MMDEYLGDLNRFYYVREVSPPTFTYRLQTSANI